MFAKVCDATSTRLCTLLMYWNRTHVIFWTSLLKLNFKSTRQGKWQQQLILTVIGGVQRSHPFWSMPKKSDNDRITQTNNKVKRRQIIKEEVYLCYFRSTPTHLRRNLLAPIAHQHMKFYLICSLRYLEAICFSKKC